MDPKVGELYYKIEGHAINPVPSDPINWHGKSGGVMEKQLRLSHTNSFREKAILILRAKNGRDLGKMGHTKRDEYKVPKKPLTYSVEYSSVYFKGPSECKILPSGNDNHSMFYVHSDLPIAFQSKVAGRYPCKITLKCKEFPDVRIFQVVATVREEVSKIELELHSKCNESVIQELPVVNVSNESWRFKISCDAEYFKAPTAVDVPPHSTTSVPILFEPKTSGEFLASVSIFNINTAQTTVYSIKGISTKSEPTAVLELSAKVGEVCTATLELADSFADSDDTFWTDLPLVSKPKAERGSDGGLLKWRFDFLPLFSGYFERSIKLIAQKTREDVWHLIKLQVLPPDPVSVLKLACAMNEPCRTTIQLQNPSESESVEFEVCFEKGQGINCDARVVISPNAEVKFPLTFTPVDTCNFYGAITFRNCKYGEFVYQLECVVEDPSPVTIPELSCPLGLKTSKALVFHNPCKSNQIVTVTYPTNHHFDISGTNANDVNDPANNEFKMELASAQEGSITVTFQPSKVGIHLPCIVKIGNRTIGWKSYKFQGRGIEPPRTAETHQIDTSLGGTFSGTICFWNPFLESTTLTACLHQEGDQFKLMTHSKIHLLGPRESVQIQYAYQPNLLKQCRAELELITTQGYKWVHSLIGCPVVDSSIPLEIKCRARESLQKVHHFQLQHLNLSPQKDNSFLTSRFKVIADNHDCPVKFEVVALDTNSPISNISVLYAIHSKKIIPETRYKITVHDLVEGAKWTFPVCLMVLPPNPDDKIVIQSRPSSIGRVSFTLNNKLDIDLPYRAYFTKEVDGLSINPTQGILIQNSKKSTGDNRLVLSYAPNDESKTPSALLVIETSEFSLFYEVKGETGVTRKK